MHEFIKVVEIAACLIFVCFGWAVIGWVWGGCE